MVTFVIQQFNFYKFLLWGKNDTIVIIVSALLRIHNQRVKSTIFSPNTFGECLSSKLVFQALWNLEFEKRFTKYLKMSKTSGKMNLGYASYGYNIDVNIWSAHQHHNITQRRWRHVLYFAFTSAPLIKCCRPLSSVCRPCGRYFILGGTRSFE